MVKIICENIFLSELGVLGVLARDIPRLTGARSAPYENFFALFAFSAANLLRLWLSDLAMLV